MIYADYTYYSGSYCGSLIPESKFGYCAARASEYIDQQTYDRLSAGVPAELTNKVSSCCCELAENIFRFSAVSGSGAGTNIVSEKNGQYSITYQSASETISAQLNGTSYGKGAGLSDLLYNIVSKHLGMTGLLYRGVDV